MATDRSRRRAYDAATSLLSDPDGPRPDSPIACSQIRAGGSSQIAHKGYQIARSWTRMHQLEQVPVLRTEVRIAAVVVRVILLAVLLWGSLVAVLSALPRERSAEEFHARWDAGQ